MKLILFIMMFASSFAQAGGGHHEYPPRGSGGGGGGGGGGHPGGGGGQGPGGSMGGGYDAGREHQRQEARNRALKAHQERLKKAEEYKCAQEKDRQAQIRCDNHTAENNRQRIAYAKQLTKEYETLVPKVRDHLAKEISDWTEIVDDLEFSNIEEPTGENADGRRRCIPILKEQLRDLHIEAGQRIVMSAEVINHHALAESSRAKLHEAGYRILEEELTEREKLLDVANETVYTPTAKLIYDYAASGIEYIADFTNGLQAGANASFTNTVQTLQGLYDNPQLVAALPGNLMNFLTDKHNIAASWNHAKTSYEKYLLADAFTRGKMVGTLVGDIAQTLCTIPAPIKNQISLMSEAAHQTMSRKLVRAIEASPIIKAEVKSSQKIVDHLAEWLGRDTKVIKNTRGGSVFLSADEQRQVRFDFKQKSYGPHMHMETYDKSIGDWVDATGKHMIFPGKK